MSSSAWSKRMAASKPRCSPRASRAFRRSGWPIKAACLRKWISTPFCSAGRSSCWSMNWRTPMRRAAAIPSAIMDVEEILGAGIDVYTTLNVQHLESLNDVVAKITRIRVRETVSDAMLDRADEVELVDLTPEDLIQRLGEGKVYVPAQAERAVHNYFKPGNLTALRELALRRTAQRVDEQMVNYMRAHAISGPWEASERVLVLVSERPGAIALVRYARRLADRLRASWAAINIETGHTQRLSEAERDRIAEALRVAERLGGVAVSVPAESVAAGVIDYAHTNNFTHIVVSTTRRLPVVGISSSAPPRTKSSAAPAISASMSCPKIARQRPRPRKNADSAPTVQRPSDDWLMPSAYAGSLGLCRCGAGRRARAAAIPRRLEYRARLSDRRARERDHVWPVALAVRLPRQRARLQFLLPAAAFTFTIADPRKCRRAVLLRGRGRHRQQSDGARARASRHGARARESDRGSLSVQPQAHGVVSLDDLSVGDRASDRVDAETARRAAAAGRRRHRGARRLSAGRFARRRRSGGRALVLGTRAAGGSRRGYSARRQTPVPAHAHRAGHGRHYRPRQRPARAAAVARSAATARRVGRSGGARDRARQSRAGYRSRKADDRDRTSAHGAAHLDLPRPAHAARLDPRLRHQPAAPIARASTMRRKTN